MKQIQPEFRPKISSNALDTSQFDSMFTNEEVAETAIGGKDMRKIQKNANKFSDFDTWL